MELSKRLKLVADAVTTGRIVADVGTDHGYVPIYLVKNHRIPSAIAMDINQGPLERAREHIRQQGCEAVIDTRLSDGLSKIEPSEAESVVIAGMGGDLILRILEAGKAFTDQGRELVLQPQSEWFKVRQYLESISYHIVKEWFVLDEGKYYVIIKALPGTVEELTEDRRIKEKYYSKGVTCETVFEYGTVLLEEKHPVYQEYIEKKIRKTKEIMERISGSDREETQKRYEVLCQELKQLSLIRDCLC